EGEMRDGQAVHAVAAGRAVPGGVGGGTAGGGVLADPVAAAQDGAGAGRGDRPGRGGGVRVRDAGPVAADPAATPAVAAGPRADQLVAAGAGGAVAGASGLVRAPVAPGPGHVDGDAGPAAGER